MESDFLDNIGLVMQHWNSTIAVGFDRIQQLFLPYELMNKISPSAIAYDKPLYSN